MFTFFWAFALLYAIYRFLDYLIRLPGISKLDERYVFITGCDTGFGNAACKKLDKLGVNVFAGCLTESGEVDLKKSCSDKVKPIRLNVTSHESVVKAFEEVKRLLPKDKGLWGVVNNAGVAGKVGPSEWCTRSDYQGVLDVNFLGLMDVTATFLPLLKKAKGRVVNTASVFGRVSFAGSAAYCISKYCVEAYSDALRREMRGFGVTVHIIEPGFHKTNITDPEVLKKNCTASFDALPQSLKDEYGREFLDESVELILKNFLKGVVAENITPVVDGYIHALTAIFPRGRYLIGMDAKFWWYPITFLPEWFSDYLLEKMAGDLPVPAALKKAA